MFLQPKIIVSESVFNHSYLNCIVVTLQFLSNAVFWDLKKAGCSCVFFCFILCMGRPRIRLRYLDVTFLFKICYCKQTKTYLRSSQKLTAEQHNCFKNLAYSYTFRMELFLAFVVVV